VDEERRHLLLGKEELTIPEVMELWGVSTPTIIKCIQEHRLDGYDAAPPGLKKARWKVKTASLRELIGI